MARELSPFSQRRLLTQQLAKGEVPTPPRVVQERVASKELERASKEPSVTSRRRSTSRSRERKPRGHTRDHKPRGASPAASASRRGRDGSPEPYRKPREGSREGKRDRSRDRHRDRSKDRRRDRSKDSRRRDRSLDKKRDRSRDRRRDRSRDKDADRDRRRERSRDRHSRRDRSRSRDRRRGDRSGDGKRSPSVSKSPPPKRRRRSRSRSHSRSPHQRTKKPLPDQEVSFRGVDNSEQAPTKYGGAPVNKEKPNFKTTGALAKHANRVEGTKISLKYHEPPEARKAPPSQPWRIFVFKGDDVIDTIELWQKSCWLLGRSHEVVDYVLEHPSSSGQHAVIQFRYIQKIVEDEFGVKSTKGMVKPYVIDLESSNGTELNGKDIESSRYCELRDKDILKFAGSEREYVVMLPPPEEKKK
ncbi:SMAD/FHA domain-containing protein [Macroventuria anomochaeta]|uniref:SMAD/FHA domain-containing protein n=1 Tax=Macroventuria anomochaeta TaxID=301207 RepID=A0ACB6RN19_9PLEO|nr:SMAD/FHA domain-containing protein [Macroventuria anomochaeta]KAF2623340.1 SMAD/FHA domain-containing protein [Macroventuria anomochaeta]